MKWRSSGAHLILLAGLERESAQEGPADFARLFIEIEAAAEFVVSLLSRLKWMGALQLHGLDEASILGALGRCARRRRWRRQR